ncbi:BBSome complex member BBS4-like [Styela clava]
MPGSTENEEIENPKENQEEVTVEPPTPKPRVRTKKPVDLPVVERRNWLIHQHFIRQEFHTAKDLILQQLAETGGECEYALYVQGMIARTEGRIAESTELLQACAKINPKSSEILKQVAKNLFLTGKYKNAIECYKQAAVLSCNDDWEISQQLGDCFLHLKQYDMAEDAFNEALKQSKHDITYSTLARLYLETSRMDKAVEVLKKGIEFSPENLDLLTTLGLLYLRMQDFHRAFELLGQAMTFDPENYKAILAAGSLMQVHGDFDVALTKYRVAAQKAPESAALWNNIAMCFYGKKKYVAAISCLKRATYLAPFDWRILYNLSLLHATMQQYASTFQFASTALRLKPKNADIYMLIAVSLNHLGQTESARKSYQEALQLKPDDVYITINYIMFLQQTKDSKQAQKLLGKLEKVMKDSSDPNLDKELIDTAKKLGVAINVGEKFVKNPPDEKPKSSSKERKKKSSKHSIETSPSSSVSSPGPSEISPSSPLTPSLLSPALSSPSSPMSPGGNLPPLKSKQPLPSLGMRASKLDALLPEVPTHSPEKVPPASKKSSKALS